jgi:hypothetical protein
MDAHASSVGGTIGWFPGRPDRYLFLQLAVSILVAIANGSIFCFGLISPSLAKAPFHFSTREINTVSTVGVVLSYCSVPTGQLYDRTTPRTTLLAGTVINIVGWTLMYLVFSGHLSYSVACVAASYSISQIAAACF